MATIVNNPGGSSDSSVGIIVSVIVLILAIALFFIYALPAIQRGNAPEEQPGSINIDVTAPSSSPGSSPGTSPSSAPSGGIY